MTRPRIVAGMAIAGVLAAALIGVLIQRSRHTAYNAADAPVQTPAIVSPPSGPEPTATAPEPAWEPADPLAPAPQIDLTGEDFNRIWRDLIAYDHWLAQHPDPELVDEVWHPEGLAYDAVREWYADLAANGHRVASKGNEIAEVEVFQRPAVDITVLRITDEQDPQAIVDAEGRVVKEGPGWALQERLVVLRFSEDGRWRLDHLAKLPAPRRSDP